jgi:hypothetical protein
MDVVDDSSGDAPQTVSLSLAEFRRLVTTQVAEANAIKVRVARPRQRGQRSDFFVVARVENEHRREAGNKAQTPRRVLESVSLDGCRGIWESNTCLYYCTWLQEEGNQLFKNTLIENAEEKYHAAINLTKNVLSFPATNRPVCAFCQHRILFAGFWVVVYAPFRSTGFNLDCV